MSVASAAATTTTTTKNESNAMNNNPANGTSSSASTTATGNSTHNSNDNPVPSITLSITQDDVKRVLEASEALTKKLKEMQHEDEELEHGAAKEMGSPVVAATKVDVDKDESVPERVTERDSKGVDDASNDDNANRSSEDTKDNGEGDSGEPPLRTVSCDDDHVKDGERADSAASNARDSSSNGRKRPLHDMIYDAAKQCENSMLQSFLERMKNSGSSQKEIRAGVMVFSDMDLNSKIQHIFDVLGGTMKKEDTTDDAEETEEERSLTRDGALSLFRAVIVAISSCIHKNARLQIEIDRETEQPANKRQKLNTPPSGADSVPSLQSPTASFDSAVGPSKDEDERIVSSVRKEFQEIAMYATDRLVKYTQKKSSIKSNDNVIITFKAFHDWRKAEGAKIAPWLDLLNLSRWKTPQRSTERSSTQSQQQSQQSKSKQAHTSPPPSTPSTAKQDLVPATETKAISAKKQPSTDVPSTRTDNSAIHAQHLAVASNRQEVDMPSMSHLQPHPSQTPLYVSDTLSRTVLSFDFSSTLPGDEGESTFCITITEENLKTFRSLVRTSGLMNRPCQDVTSILLEASKKRIYYGEETKVIPIERFHTCLHQLLGSGSSKRLSKVDRDIFSSCFVDFFSCFNSGLPPLEPGEALTSELSGGFCFLCAGNKSTKLATGFELLEKEKGRGLTSEQLVHFLRSYLTMLAGISLLTSSTDGIMKPKLNAQTRKVMYAAVENGARWTLRHFLKPLGIPESDTRTRHTFESFASWYSTGGYNIAPWLELLDLKKLLCLVADDELSIQSPPLAHDALPAFPGPKTSSPEFDVSPHPALQPSSRHRSSRHSSIPAPRAAAEASGPFPHTPLPPHAHVLFTFPLANQCSLVVLKEDATYVRGVVDQLGLLSHPPEEIWSTLYNIAMKKPPPPPSKSQKKQSKGVQSPKSMLVNKELFVDCMQETIQSKGHPSKKRNANGMSKSLSSLHDILANFFQSFDLLQSDRVPLNELMGGLTLLCGGKKSTKLSFAFSVFDRRQNTKKKGKKAQPMPNSLDGEELFLFLRSFLIVMFSCCKQSLDLTDDAVNRYIADTANMVAEDVMRYQWRTRKKERVDFDEFGQWYNEGGFEHAPWLELLDLTKWVLVDNFEELEKHRTPPSPGAGLVLPDPDCPPPPPDADVDPSFFDDDGPGIMQMDSIDEMDLLLMQQPSHDKDDMFSRFNPFSPKASPKPQAPPPQSKSSLKFHLVTDDSHDGYVVSLGQKRVRHIRQVLLESGLYRIIGEHASREILAVAHRETKSQSGSSTYVLTKKDFDSAMLRVITSRSMSVDTQTTLTSILREIFSSFDYDGSGKADAFDVACGFTVLCQGKKSDKLEHAFEVLDRTKRGFLSRSDTVRYLRSFLVVLLTFATTSALDSEYTEDTMMTTSGEKCDMSKRTISQAIESGCRWAAAQAMKNNRGTHDVLSFDDFADWYTKIGYSNIPWLELLDLNKWAIDGDGAKHFGH